MYESGDLRFFAVTVKGDQGCIADGFCLTCDRCPAGERCTSRVTSTSPVASYLGCAPIGPKALGETCELIASDLGAYDDCGDGLLCIGGVCRRTCNSDSGACTGCDYVPGHAPEHLVCM
jgi:hypothetical protein